MSTKVTRREKWIKTFKFLTAYLVAAWSFLQFVDWILTRYEISPYWVDILLWFFIGIIPSLLIYLYHQERINKKILLRREKIIFPINLVLVFLGLYLGFGTSDLGATTKEVKYMASNGNIEETTITKDEFRTIIPIFNFTSKSKDSTLEWIGNGIAGILFYDLFQDKGISPNWEYAKNTTDKVMAASLTAPFYVDGSYDKNGEVYSIETTIRSSKNGVVKASKIFEGTDLLDILDTITVYLKNEVGSTGEGSMKYLDLDVKEFMSKSLPALEDFFNEDYDGAIAKDSTFALAYLRNSRRNIYFSVGKFEEQTLAEKAFELRDKLPYDLQMEAMALRYLAYDKYKEAKKLVEMQLEISPQNNFLKSLLNNIYGETKDVASYFSSAEKQFDAEKSEYNLMTIANASLAQGEYERYIKMVDVYTSISPNNNYIFPFALVPQLLSGKIDDAKKTFDKLNLIHPDNQKMNSVFEAPLTYLDKNEMDELALDIFEGEFKSENSEAIETIWATDNKLLAYYSNQEIATLIPASETKLVAGIPNQKTYEYEFKQNAEGEVYAFLRREYYSEISIDFWMWKLDESITKAEGYLIEGDYINAEKAYMEAIAANPQHYYLKNALQHIHYVKEKDSLELLQQFKGVVGTYANDKVENKRWLELVDGQLKYKRESQPSKLLLPLSETTYMTMSSYRNRYEFVFEDDKTVTSSVWIYNPKKLKWENFNPDVNSLKRIGR